MQQEQKHQTLTTGEMRSTGNRAMNLFFKQITKLKLLLLLHPRSLHRCEKLRHLHSNIHGGRGRDHTEKLKDNKTSAIMLRCNYNLWKKPTYTRNTFCTSNNETRKGKGCTWMNSTQIATAIQIIPSTVTSIIFDSWCPEPVSDYKWQIKITLPTIV